MSSPARQFGTAGTSEVLRTRELTKSYRMGQIDVHALRGVDFAVERGEFVSIMGNSGSGKSTLLHIIGGLLAPSSGDVVIDGRSVSTMDDAERTDLRRRSIGFIFQRFNLFPTLSLAGNLKLAARVYQNGDAPMTEDDPFLVQLLDELGLSGKLRHKPFQLSGGEQQRVAIARAVLHQPAILLADEPTGNLDSETSHRVLELLSWMNEQRGQTILMITHSAEAAAVAARTLQMRDGRLSA